MTLLMGTPVLVWLTHGVDNDDLLILHTGHIISVTNHDHRNHHLRVCIEFAGLNNKDLIHMTLRRELHGFETKYGWSLCTYPYDVSWRQEQRDAMEDLVDFKVDEGRPPELQASKHGLSLAMRIVEDPVVVYSISDRMGRAFGVGDFSLTAQSRVLSNNEVVHINVHQFNCAHPISVRSLVEPAFEHNFFIDIHTDSSESIPFRLWSAQGRHMSIAALPIHSDTRPVGGGLIIVTIDLCKCAKTLNVNMCCGQTRYASH